VARFLANRRNRELPHEEILSLRDEAREALVIALRACTSASEIGDSLSALVRYGMPINDPTMIFGAALLRANQLADGRWFDCGEDEAVFATASAVRGLVAAGLTHEDASVAAGINWLLVHQSEFGDWGSVEQTSAALSALVAAGVADDEAARRGVEKLLDFLEQPFEDDTAFDLASMTKCLRVLSRWAIAATAANTDDTPTSLRLVGGFSLVN
jgi:hypothetical protein